ncbi:MAG: hypothetical protein JO121_31905, partial [Deltaproteobacteria bacterium]|nr:hypothetical protein [Deltaproteobacteria bacterium]
MFSHEEQWREARSFIGGVLFFHSNLPHISDEQMLDWMRKLRAWNLLIELEVGAIKEWSTDGEKSVRLQKGAWDRLTKLGGEIGSFAMDSPRDKAVVDMHLGEDFAVEQTVRFIGAVRRAYPNALVGDIEQYPMAKPEEHIRWIDRLEEGLRKSGLRGLDFYRLDVDWAEFKEPKDRWWRDVKRIEDHCHERHIGFSLIYWASHFNKHVDKSWYDGIMYEGKAYRDVGGVPDQYVIESWLAFPVVAV